MTEPYDYQKYYAFWHDESTEHAARMAADAITLLEPLIEDVSREAALDVGCGMGFAMLGLKALGFSTVHGIDIDRRQVESAKRKGLEVELTKDTKQFLAAVTNHYSLILLLDVLEHIPVSDQINFLRAIYLSLRTSGRLIIKTPNANSQYGLRWRYNDYSHTASFTEHSLRFVLANAGFEKIRLHPYGKITRPSFRIWKRHGRDSWAAWLLHQLWMRALRYQFSRDNAICPIPTGIDLLATCDK